MGKFRLELHPEKTRLIEFGRYATERRAKRGEGSRRPLTFWVPRHHALKSAFAGGVACPREPYYAPPFCAPRQAVS